MKRTPQQYIETRAEAALLPGGAQERFSGYGLMGLPFSSGHILALRRFSASSVGPAYVSVWHRSPDSNWTFYANVPPYQSCARYFGSSLARSVEAEIHLRWLDPFRMMVSIPSAQLEWEFVLGSSPAVWLMNRIAGLLPKSAWKNTSVLALMGKVAGLLLRAGRIGLFGKAPNRQGFIANPLYMWSVTASRAQIGNVDFGEPGAVQPQANLGDFWIPQRGILAIGQAFFDPFDPALHLANTSIRNDPKFEKIENQFQHAKEILIS